MYGNCQRQELIHPIVKFMIARDGNVISCRVHQFQRRLALRHRPNRFALDEIPVIHKQGVTPLVFIILPDLIQPIEAKILIHTAMDIARKQNHQIAVRNTTRISDSRYTLSFPALFISPLLSLFCLPANRLICI